MRAAHLRITSPALFGVIVLLFAVQDVAAEAEGSGLPWSPGQRMLSAPAAASEALRASIAASPAPDVAARRASAPRSTAQWREVIRARAEQGAGLVDRLDGLGLALTEERIAGVVVRRVGRIEPDPDFEGRVFLHLHGGAYVFGGGVAGANEAAVITARTGIETVSVDYRMPPDHPFPAAVDDALRVYRALLERYPAERIAMGGTSAGGGLTLAAVQRAIAEGLPAPAAVWLGTPWADLGPASDSLHTLEGVDRILVSYEGLLASAARLYAGPAGLAHPGVSPLYGDFAGFPPTQLVTGTRDMLLSDTARTHQALRGAGAEADLLVFEGFSHAGYVFVPEAPESARVYEEMRAFLLRTLE